MSLQDQVVSIDFGLGVSTKTDPKHVVIGKLLRLENAIFTNEKQTRKRNGNDSINLSIVNGGSISSPIMTRSFNGESLLADGSKLYSYTPTLGTGAWIPKGNYQSVSVTEKQISTYYAGVNYPTMASNGSYTIAAYVVGGGALGGTAGVYISVMDNASQSFLIQDRLLVGSSLQYPQCVLIGGSTLGVVYIDSSGNVDLVTVSFSGTNATLNSPIILASNANTSNPWVNCSTNGSFNFLAYAYSGGGTANGIGVVSFNATGAVASTFFSQTFTPTYVTCQVDASNNLWVYWANTSTASSSSIYYQIYTSGLTGVSNGTVVSSLANISNVSVSNQTNGHQYVYYSTNTQGSSSFSPNYVTTLYAEVSTSSVVSTNNAFLTNVEIESKWVNYNGTNYAVFGTVAGNILDTSASGQIAPQTNIGNQRTFFLVNESTKAVVAKCFYGEAVTGGSSILRGVLSSLQKSGTAIVFGAPFTFYSEITTVGGGLNKLALTGLSVVTFNFSDAEAYQGLIANDTLVLNGGIVQMYDGKWSTELGFSQYPENVVLTLSASGGSITAGTYNYAAVYEWYDAAGNFHQSAPQKTLSISTSGTASSVSVDIQTLAITQKISPNTNAITIALYRTTNAGQVFYKVNQTTNDPTVNKVTIVDTVSDSQINGIADIQLYTGGNVIENIAPPPSMVMWTNNTRLLILNSEQPTKNVWYSKSFSPGLGIQTSDLLTITIDSKFGTIKSIAGMDTNTFFIKEKGIFYVNGDGADDTGANSSYSKPLELPTDVGASSSRATILIPPGLVFQTNKGLYIISRGIEVEYFGNEVEAYNSQPITQATMMPSKNAVRFLTSSGLTLHYDYFYKQWSTFTNFQGYSADIWNGKYIYVRTDGKVYLENTTSFLDGTTSYNWLAQTAWLDFAGISGFQRARNALVLGDFGNGTNASHGVSVTPSFDFGNGLVESQPAVSFYPGAANASGVLNFLTSLKTQKCDAVSLLIQEITTGASGEYINLSTLGFEVGLKKGSNKMPATNRVG